MAALAAASLSHLHRASAQDLALLAYSFAALGMRPPEAWWARFWPACCARLGETSSQGLANTLWALARLKRVSVRERLRE